jgi:hypothetical protein
MFNVLAKRLRPVEAWCAEAAEGRKPHKAVHNSTLKQKTRTLPPSATFQWMHR